MSTLLLKRCELPEVDPQDLMSDDVLNYAHESLGYHHPKKEHLCKEGSLAKALRIAGIVPFSHDSVRAYKVEQVEKIEGKKDKIVLPIIKVTCIAFGLSIGLLIMHSAIDAIVVKSVFGVASSVCAVAFMLCFAVLVILAITDKRASWRRIPLKEYVSPVPGFALATAKEIHQRVPNSVFFIEELVVSKVQHDPFLVVGGDGEEYHVEVWDEPGYEQKRKA